LRQRPLQDLHLPGGVGAHCGILVTLYGDVIQGIGDIDGHRLCCLAQCVLLQDVARDGDEVRFRVPNGILLLHSKQTQKYLLRYIGDVVDVAQAD